MEKTAFGFTSVTPKQSAAAELTGKLIKELKQKFGKKGTETSLAFIETL